jgi:hypothetical protein
MSLPSILSCCVYAQCDGVLVHWLIRSPFFLCITVNAAIPSLPFPATWFYTASLNGPAARSTPLYNYGIGKLRSMENRATPFAEAYDGG